MASARFVLGVIAIALALMAPDLVRAQTCATDADCAKGTSCQTDAVMTAPGVACTVDSDGGRICTPVPAPAPTTVTMSCQAAPCTSSADCGPAMICHSETVSNCGNVEPNNCDPATGCTKASPVSCTNTTVARCTYPWTLPCNADADCGADFTCKPSEIAMCTGSAGIPAAGGSGTSSGSGGAIATPPTPPASDGGLATTATCTVTTSFPGYCQARSIACTSDADCPQAWTCATVNQVAVGSAPAPAPVDGGATVEPPSPLTPVVSTTPAKTCQPPAIGGTRGGATDDGNGASYQPPTVNLGLPDAGTTSTKAGTPGAASAPDAGAATTANTPPTPTTNQGTTTTESTPVAARTSSGGCSVGASANASWLAGLLAVLGLLVTRRRRG